MCFKKMKKCLLEDPPLFLLDKAKPLYQEYAELGLRLVAGGFMLTHGYSKISSFSEKSGFFPDPLGIGSALSLGLATFAEFFCAILLIVGLLTRFASINILFTMLVAGLIFHSADPFNKKELALLYALVFCYFVVVGGNRLSLDHLIRKRFFVKKAPDKE